MLPSIGRVVKYTLSDYDAEAINRRRDDAIQTQAWNERKGYVVHSGNPVYAGEKYPMVITRVWDTSGIVSEATLVNGQVLLDGNDTFWATSVSQGPNQHMWLEFERV